MGNETDLDPTLIMTQDILGAKAIPDSADVLNGQLRLHIPQGFSHNWVDFLGGVTTCLVATVLYPVWQVDFLEGVHLNGVAIEQVDDEGGVAACRELVSEELAVVPNAKDVGYVEYAGILASVLG